MGLGKKHYASFQKTLRCFSVKICNRELQYVLENTISHNKAYNMLKNTLRSTRETNFLSKSIYHTLPAYLLHIIKKGGICDKNSLL